MVPVSIFYLPAHRLDATLVHFQVYFFLAIYLFIPSFYVLGLLLASFFLITTDVDIIDPCLLLYYFFVLLFSFLLSLLDFIVSAHSIWVHCYYSYLGHGCHHCFDCYYFILLGHFGFSFIFFLFTGLVCSWKVLLWLIQVIFL